MSRAHDDAVSDVLGTILMVGITVTMMAGLSLLVLNIQGPADQIHADLAITIGPGAGGWGTGDEQVIIRHLGGERIHGDVQIVVLNNGLRTDLDPTDQGWLDGFFTIGERWAGSLTIAEGDRLEIGVLDLGGNGFVQTADAIAGQAVIPAGNQSPTASYSFSCTLLACTFDGSGSSDSDGTITSWAWDFDPGSASAATTAHTFATAGTYGVALTVTDNEGATGMQTVPVTVSLAPNNPPTASFTFSCTLLACTFDGTGSTDTDGTIASWSWAFDPGNGSGATTAHTYTLAGTHNVVLTVTDDGGATGQQTETVTVIAGAPFDPGFAYEDVGCDGGYDAGTDSNVGASVADGTHNAGGNCLVIPPSVGALTQSNFNYDARGIIVRVALTSTNGDIDIDSGDQPLDVTGMTLHGEDDIFLHGDGEILLSGATLMTDHDDIQIGWSNSGSLRPSFINMQNAQLIGDDDVRVRSDGQIQIQSSMMQSLSNGNNLRAESVGAASMFVQSMIIDDQDDVLEVTPSDAPVGTPAQGTTE